MFTRTRRYLTAARRMHGVGATWSSLVAYPLRRRVGAKENFVCLADGARFFSPGAESLFSIVEEVWGDQCYTQAMPISATTSGVIVDIGANVGVFAVWAAIRFPAARVVAVEPDPLNLTYLRRNVEQNSLSNVCIVPFGCGGSHRQAKLYVRGGGSWTTLYQRDNYGSQFQPGASIELRTLREIFEGNAIDRCSLLKLDCEGAEYEILLDCDAALLNKVECIAMEYHVGMNEFVPEQLATFLQGHGFLTRQTSLLDEEGGYLYAYRAGVQP